MRHVRWIFTITRVEQTPQPTSESQEQSWGRGCQIPAQCKDDSRSQSPPCQPGLLAATPALWKHAAPPTPPGRCLRVTSCALLGEHLICAVQFRITGEGSTFFKGSQAKQKTLETTFFPICGFFSIHLSSAAYPEPVTGAAAQPRDQTKNNSEEAH